jgi:hypothetical protein
MMLNYVARLGKQQKVHSGRFQYIPWVLTWGSFLWSRKSEDGSRKINPLIQLDTNWFGDNLRTSDS